MRLEIIVISFSCLLLMLLPTACKDKQTTTPLQNGQIAILVCYEKDKTIYEVQLFQDSTFRIPKKYSVTESSDGTFSRSFTRLYFNTTKGRNELCDFYYVDTFNRTFWTNEGCGDKQNLKMETWR